MWNTQSMSGISRLRRVARVKRLVARAQAVTRHDHRTTTPRAGRAIANKRPVLTGVAPKTTSAVLLLIMTESVRKTNAERFRAVRKRRTLLRQSLLGLLKKKEI
jgi:hypothetical protein